MDGSLPVAGQTYLFVTYAFRRLVLVISSPIFAAATTSVASGRDGVVDDVTIR
jgi:hypothetical protein